LGELRLSLFGGFKVELDGMSLRAFESDKARLLLAYLAVESSRLHRRENLAGLFWPEKPESQAHHSLSQAISSLNKKLRAQSGNTILETTPQEICFRAEKAWLDVDEFEALLQACMQHNHPTPWDCAACLERVVRLAALYTGEFLEGLDLPGCLVFEDWLRLQRETYRMKMIRAMGWLSQGCEAAGELEKALGFANRWIVLDPLDEAAHRRVMQVLSRLGRRSDALAQYAACQRLLAEELGVEPDEETTALYQQIKTPSGGEGRAEGSLSNLPARLAPLVGRQIELERLPHKLLDPDCRLITLLGPGGVGKTSLALELGMAVSANFPDGVCLIEFDAQQSSRSLLQALALAAGLGQSPGSEGSLARSQLDLVEQVCAHLKPRRLLLILDGFEGMVHEAHLVGRLLSELPLLKILVTSRLRLNLASEQIFLVQGLSFPAETAFENLDSYTAVRLFVVAARRSDPNFELNPLNEEAVVAICRLVQGVPLGILLAAAWVNILPVEKIVQEIQHSLDFLAAGWNDLPDRQRSLRATFDHSWRLLSQTGRSVFMRLAVIHGPFSSERAYQVAEAALEDLKSLVEQSLLQRVEADRFRIHDLLRQYAQEKLAASPAESMEIHQRYCRVYLEALAECEQRLKSAEQPVVLAEIDQEYTDILAAWEWAAAQQEFELLDKTLESLRYYHQLSGYYAEGKELYQRTMDQIEVREDNPVSLRLWIKLGIWLANLFYRLRVYEQAHQVATRVGDRLAGQVELAAKMRREQALIHLCKGDVILLSNNNYLSALEHYQQGLDLMLAGEDAWDISLALLKNSVGNGQAGNPLVMGPYIEQAMAFQRALGDPDMIAGILAELGFFYMLTGDYEAGIRVAEEHGVYLIRINNRFYQAIHKQYLALALYYAGNYAQARSMFQETILVLTHPIETGNRLFSRYILAGIDLQLGDYTAVLKEAAFAGEPLGDYYQNAMDIFRAEARLITGDWDGAEPELRNYYEKVMSLPRYDMAGQPLALLGYIAYRRGDRAAALGYLEQALVNGMEKGFFWVFMLALATLAVMLAEAGELEQALEVYAAVTAHPCAGNSQWFEDLFGTPLREMCAGLPSEAIEAAQRRGRSRKLREVGEGYLEKLRMTEDRNPGGHP
jgi:DNA-binding SARP family transcriptional activator/predicted ATPase